MDMMITGPGCFDDMFDGPGHVRKELSRTTVRYESTEDRPFHHYAQASLEEALFHDDPCVLLETGLVFRPALISYTPGPRLPSPMKNTFKLSSMMLANAGEKERRLVEAVISTTEAMARLVEAEYMEMLANVGQLRDKYCRNGMTYLNICVADTRSLFELGLSSKNFLRNLHSQNNFTFELMTTVYNDPGLHTRIINIGMDDGKVVVHGISHRAQFDPGLLERLLDVEELTARLEEL